MTTKNKCIGCKYCDDENLCTSNDEECYVDVYNKGYADAFEDALSGVGNLVNTECNSSCECQPDCLYLDAISDAMRILKQLKEQKK